MEPEKLVKVRLKGKLDKKESFELGFGIFKKNLKFSADGITEVTNFMAQKILKEFPGSYEIVQEEVKPIKQERTPKASKSSDEETKEFAKQM